MFTCTGLMQTMDQPYRPCTGNIAKETFYITLKWTIIIFIQILTLLFQDASLVIFLGMILDLPSCIEIYIITFILFFPHFHAHVYFHAHAVFQLCRNWWNLGWRYCSGPSLEIQYITSIIISHFFMHSTFILILMLQFCNPV